MGEPLVTIIWLNYNSSKIIDIVEKSLKAIAELDYNNYEVVIVDNASTDGSYERIRALAERLPIRKKIIRNTRNLGFTGGCNTGYRARDPESRYVVLLNNDAIPYPWSLREMVECIEHTDNIGAAQGIIIDMKTGRIDTAGDMLDEMLLATQLFHGSEPTALRKPIRISYADGAYSIYRVEAVRKATKTNDKLFYDPMFAYFDDNVLGVQLWNAGYTIISCPFKAGLHRRSSTFNQFYYKKAYLMTRGYYALIEMTNTRYKWIAKELCLHKSLYGVLLSMIGKKMGLAMPSASSMLHAVVRGCRDGIKWGQTWRRRHGVLDIYKMPIIPLNPKLLLLQQIGIGSAIMRRTYTHSINKILAEYLEKLYL